MILVAKINYNISKPIYHSFSGFVFVLLKTSICERHLTTVYGKDKICKLFLCKVN